jgi:hypothetical protein
MASYSSFKIRMARVSGTPRIQNCCSIYFHSMPHRQSRSRAMWNRLPQQHALKTGGGQLFFPIFPEKNPETTRGCDKVCANEVLGPQGVHPSRQGLGLSNGFSNSPIRTVIHKPDWSPANQAQNATSPPVVTGGLVFDVTVNRRGAYGLAIVTAPSHAGPTIVAYLAIAPHW